LLVFEDQHGKTLIMQVTKAACLASSTALFQSSQLASTASAGISCNLIAFFPHTFK
jgi:hypothetical protein